MPIYIVIFRLQCICVSKTPVSQPMLIYNRMLLRYWWPYLVPVNKQILFKSQRQEREMAIGYI